MFNFKVESSVGNHRREGVGLSKEEWEGSLLTSCARGTRTMGMCSFDARSGRPNRPPSCEEKVGKLGRIIWKDESCSMRAVTGSLGHSSKERHWGVSLWLHSDVMTTMMYIHVLNCGSGGVRSPPDGL